MIGSNFTLHDLSQITEVSEITVSDSSPLILAAFGADKGTEDLFVLSGANFVKMFGDPSFKKYGQCSTQARALVDAGATIIGKRVVATDAKLANLIVVAKLYKTTTQKTDGTGALLYWGENAVETTDAGIAEDLNDPIMVNTAHVKYEVVSASGSSIDAIKTAMTAEKDIVGTANAEGNLVFSYPLFTIYDNGRGISAKGFNIVPENSLSKNLSYMLYTLDIIENGDITDKVRFAAIPDTVVGTECIDMNSKSNSTLSMAKAYMDEEMMTAFIAKLAVSSDIDQDTLVLNDVIFGTDRKGTAYSTIKVDTTTGVDMTVSTGLSLEGGTSGSFGANPASGSTAEVAAYNAKLLAFFDGSDTDDIYDVDSYQIAACFGANYTTAINEAIVKLAEWRKDFFFFRDFGTTCTTLDAVIAKAATYTKSTFAADYCQSYDIVDKYSKKQVSATINIDIAPKMLSIIEDGGATPFAGSRGGATIASIIKGTLSYKPRKTPVVNEKDTLEDARVNFGSYYGDTFTLESVYTSQEDYTQMSFIPHVMAVQTIIRKLRAYFPAVRFAYLTSEDDVNAYTTAVNNFLSQYAGMFEELTFSYDGDSTYLDNKIYKAKLTYRFTNFIQAEQIDAYALPTA